MFPEPAVQRSVETRDLESYFQGWPSRTVGRGTPLKQYFIRWTLYDARLCIKAYCWARQKEDSTTCRSSEGFRAQVLELSFEKRFPVYEAGRVERGKRLPWLPELQQHHCPQSGSGHPCGGGLDPLCALQSAWRDRGGYKIRTFN